MLARIALLLLIPTVQATSGEPAIYATWVPAVALAAMWIGGTPWRPKAWRWATRRHRFLAGPYK